MADVETTVRDSILRYPGLYSSRVSVLHHILCVIGNGYEWVDGQPQAEEGGRTEVWTPEWERTNPDDAWIYSLPKTTQDSMLATQERLIQKQIQVVANVDRLAAEWGELEGGIYQQSNYALLMNVPDDVTLDWDIECQRMRQFLIPQWTF